MAEESRSLTKLRESTQKLKAGLRGVRAKLKEAHEGADENNKKASKVPPFLLPVGGGAIGYGMGIADAYVQTPDVKNPITIATGGAAWLGSGVATYFGKPTLATLAGTTAAVSAGIVAHAAGFNKGSEHAARG